jgi:hypothetical protein
MPPKQPLSAPPIPQKALKLSRKVDECKPLPKGYGFFEYSDPAATEPAIRGLNGMRLGDKMLTLKLAGPGSVAALALGALGAESTTAAYGQGLTLVDFWLNLSAFCGIGVHLGIF